MFFSLIFNFIHVTNTPTLDEYVSSWVNEIPIHNQKLIMLWMKASACSAVSGIEMQTIQ